jgi:acetyltransferase
MTVRGTWTAADGTPVTIRDISPDDLELEREFVDSLSPSTGYQRLMSSRRLSAEELRRFTDIDPRHQRALIAVARVDRAERQLGVARYVKTSRDRAEFAIVLRDDWQHRGLGSVLLRHLVAEARQDGLAALFGTTFASNAAMLRLAGKLGFRTAAEPGAAFVRNLTKELHA